MKHLKRNILAITLASMHIMGSGYNVDALETKTTSNNIVRTITYMEVTGNSVNVRTGPSTSYKSIMKLNKGYKVEYISSSGNWSKIMYNGKTGYMSSQYLSTTNPIENTKPETQGEVLFPDWFKEGKNILVRDDYASNLNNAFTVEDYNTGKKF